MLGLRWVPAPVGGGTGFLGIPAGRIPSIVLTGWIFGLLEEVERVNAHALCETFDGLEGHVFFAPLDGALMCPVEARDLGSELFLREALAFP